MNLLIDIGNTRIKWAAQCNQRLHLVDAFVHRNQKTLSALLDQFWLNLEAPDSILICSVAGQHLNRQITEWCKQTWGIVPRLVSVNSAETEITSHYCLQSLGVDRWMALLALKDRFKLPAIVVDCGSAVTADVLDEQANHLGGLIMPGLSMMRAILHQDTHALPAISESAGDSIGLTTVQAISSGTLNAVCGMIERFINNVKQQGCSDPGIVLTGGDAEHVAGALERPLTIEPNLVLLGLMLAAKLNSNSGKHQTAKNQ